MVISVRDMLLRHRPCQPVPSCMTYLKRNEEKEEPASAASVPIIVRLSSILALELAN